MSPASPRVSSLPCLYDSRCALAPRYDASPTVPRLCFSPALEPTSVPPPQRLLLLREFNFDPDLMSTPDWLWHHSDRESLYDAMVSSHTPPAAKQGDLLPPSVPTLSPHPQSPPSVPTLSPRPARRCPPHRPVALRSIAWYVTVSHTRSVVST